VCDLRTQNNINKRKNTVQNHVNNDIKKLLSYGEEIIMGRERVLRTQQKSCGGRDGLCVVWHGAFHGSVGTDLVEVLQRESGLMKKNRTIQKVHEEGLVWYVRNCKAAKNPSGAESGEILRVSCGSIG